MGWNLPDGCGKLPGENVPPDVCDTCGREYDNAKSGDPCKCEPCVMHEVPGCIECMDLRNLADRYWALKREFKRRGLYDDQTVIEKLRSME